MLYLFVDLIRVYHPTRKFFTHIETSPSLVKGCKLWPASVYNGHLRGRATMTPVAERLAFRTLPPKLLHSRPCSNRLRCCWGHCIQYNRPICGNRYIVAIVLSNGPLRSWHLLVHIMFWKQIFHTDNVFKISPYTEGCIFTFD